MALLPIKLAPGINTQPTSLSNESGWSASANIRWKDGLPEKLGGFVKFTMLPAVAAGLPQALRPWTALSGLSWLGIGTQRRLFVFGGEGVYDITPQTIAATIPLRLSTTKGDAHVTIDDVNAPGEQATAIKAVRAPGTGYAPNDTWTAAGGIDPEPATVLTITQTQVVSATVVAPGTGGTPGSTTITGTTGDGTTMFQATGTIDGSGHLTGPLVIVTPGSYTTNPDNIAAEPVITADGALTGATVSLGMGVLAATITTPGSYETPPANPVAQGATSGSGTGATFILTYAVNQWVNIRAPVTVGGIVLLGSYLITSVTNASFTIITATEASSTVANGGNARKFTTASGSSTVTANLPSHGLFTGEAVTIPDATPVGGITLLGNYTATVIDQNNYTITTLAAAAFAQTVIENDGEIQLSFMDPPNGAGSQTGLNASAASSLANWGEFLMWCPQNGPVYLWKPAKGPSTLASFIPTAPQNNTFIFVASQQEMLFCLGTVDTSTKLFDPMLLAWSDAGDYTVFIPAVTNQAGSFRLSVGSRIVAGLALASGTVIWTDLAVYQGSYIGPPLVWGFQPISLNYGLAGPQAFGTLGANVFWCGRVPPTRAPGVSSSAAQFYVMVGGSPPQAMPCTVWDAVFKNADPANQGLIVCETNASYNEVAWEVPQLDGTVVRAKVQIDAGLWDYTILPIGAATPRTAWTDQSVFGMPIGADAEGVLWQHDVGKDAGDQPLEWSLTSGQIMIAEGDQMVFFRNILPNFKFTADGSPGPGIVQAFIYVYDRPQDPPKVKGPFPISSTTRYVKGCRGRGRALQFEFSGKDLGSFVRLGLVRYRGAPDGRR